MFCARCGEQIPEASQICPLCGREANVKLALAPASAAPAPALEPSSTAPVLPIRKDLQGVGGWLLFFCISLVLLGPLAILAETTSSSIDTAGIVLDIARASFGVVVAIFIWRVRPLVFPLLWIYFGIVALIAVLGIIGFALTVDQSEPRDLVVPVRSLIYVVIWVLYFRSSQRVRATFGRNL